MVVAANGSSDLIYLPGKNAALAKRVIEFLLTQDYVSGLFVDDDLGAFAGTLPLSAINLRGAAVTPRPAIVVNFRSFSTGCEEPVLCAATVADTTLQQGQGMHGSLSRADTMNFMALAGPDFKKRFVDDRPVSNADLGRTIFQVLGLQPTKRGSLSGRVMTEALADGVAPASSSKVLKAPSALGPIQTVLMYQVVGETKYFDIAGSIGRTLGLERDPE